tara:strand:- start:315 stop:1139 length:825 start_codon:yes stop_codon:yes gene_type:complete
MKEKNKKIILILILISILILIYYIYVNIKKIILKKEKFIVNNIIFKEEIEIKRFIKEDKDNYIKNLSSYDLNARKVKSKNEYLEKIINCVTNFNENQKIVIKESCIEADKFLENYNEMINGKELLKIGWKFGITKYNKGEYEEGLPHTREDIIFLSDKMIPNKKNSDFINTLIHEKVHIYQRYNEKEMKKYLEKEYIEIEKDKRSRSNPDINKKNYMDKNKNKLECIYKNSEPESIMDVKCMNNSSMYEHPYEYMAYKIANTYNKKELERFKNI